MTNVIIQTFTGIVGGHAAASLTREHGFGWVGHSIVGAVGGLVSGVFFQTLAATVVTASGSLNEPTAVENFVVQVLTGVAAGGCLTLIVGLLKHSSGRA
jgi:hypothetical protein